MKREEAEAIYDLGKEAVVEILLKMDARITALEIRLGPSSNNLKFTSSKKNDEKSTSK
jgi:hypothetical protein